MLVPLYLGPSHVTTPGRSEILQCLLLNVASVEWQRHRTTLVSRSLNFAVAMISFEVESVDHTSDTTARSKNLIWKSVMTLESHYSRTDTDTASYFLR